MFAEYPECYGMKVRKARIAHVCCECGGKISKGESYHYHCNLCGHVVQRHSETGRLKTWMVSRCEAEGGVLTRLYLIKGTEHQRRRGKWAKIKEAK